MCGSLRLYQTTLVFVPLLLLPSSFSPAGGPSPVCHLLLHMTCILLSRTLPHSNLWSFYTFLLFSSFFKSSAQIHAHFNWVIGFLDSLVCIYFEYEPSISCLLRLSPSLWVSSSFGWFLCCMDAVQLYEAYFVGCSRAN